MIRTYINLQESESLREILEMLLDRIEELEEEVKELKVECKGDSND